MRALQPAPCVAPGMPPPALSDLSLSSCPPSSADTMPHPVDSIAPPRKTRPEHMCSARHFEKQGMNILDAGHPWISLRSERHAGSGADMLWEWLLTSRKRACSLFSFEHTEPLLVSGNPAYSLSIQGVKSCALDAKLKFCPLVGVDDKPWTRWPPGWSHLRLRVLSMFFQIFISAMSNLYWVSRRHCRPTASILARMRGSRSSRLCSNSFRAFALRIADHGSPFSLHQ